MTKDDRRWGEPDSTPLEDLEQAMRHLNPDHLRYGKTEHAKLEADVLAALLSDGEVFISVKDGADPQVIAGHIATALAHESGRIVIDLDSSGGQIAGLYDPTEDMLRRHAIRAKKQRGTPPPEYLKHNRVRKRR